MLNRGFMEQQEGIRMKKTEPLDYYSNIVLSWKEQTMNWNCRGDLENELANELILVYVPGSFRPEN